MEINIPVGEFKTHCYKMLDDAQKNNNQLIITKRGSAIAKITPLNKETKKSLIGILKGKAEVKGDIIESLEVKWDAASE